MTFEGGSLWGLLLKIGVDQGLHFVDPTSHNTTLATPTWEKLAVTLTELVKNKALRFSDESNDQMLDAFIQGKSAMTFNTDSYVKLLDAKKNEGQMAFSWSFTPFPINAKGILQSPIQLEEIISVNRSSDHQSNALKVLSFLEGQKMQRVYQGRGELSTRIPDFTTSSSMLPYQPLYQPVQATGWMSYGEVMDNLPRAYKRKLTISGEQEMQATLDGNIDIPAALKKIEDDVPFVEDQ